MNVENFNTGHCHFLKIVHARETWWRSTSPTQVTICDDLVPITAKPVHRLDKDHLQHNHLSHRLGSLAHRQPVPLQSCTPLYLAPTVYSVHRELSLRDRLAPDPKMAQLYSQIIGFPPD
ncbi:hypothetical protein CY34DRAFT_752992 [Suillus luteus UH-Slu-Lm8-n1]|uniref:Uncharacterized protein n=1 Tax=Suillus luteus UH-Slu-Lm8-n1 TaxID=930992 RepID=A0A0C9ZYI1_9AGAM|nr:hypothetical protein CY34DRAFT_752992 [Suillus luteus UH-Slu-Lm8-n1]